MRNLRPDEIECRVNIINQKGLSLLLYKTARTDMTILDEVYGAGWSCEYREIKGNLFCGISVKINEEWITRWDCGVESREDGNGNEKKGEASDSFKRAGTKWGIGRELYTAPKLIWISAGDYEGKEAGKDKNGKTKYMTYDTFSVTEIGTENGTITSLKIINDKTKKIVYVLGSGIKPAPKTPAPKQTPADVEKADKELVAKFNELNNRLSKYLNKKGMFDHPDVVRQFVAAKDIKKMEAAVAQAEQREAEQKKKEEQKKQAEQEAKPEQFPIF